MKRTEAEATTARGFSQEFTKTTIKTETFRTPYTTETDGGEVQIMVDIVTDETTGVYEAYIYGESYGIKSHLFGVSIEDTSYEAFLALVDDDLFYSDAIEDYARDYIN